MTAKNIVFARVQALGNNSLTPEWERCHTPSKGVEELLRVELFTRQRKSAVATFVRTRALGNSLYTAEVFAI